MTLRIDADYVRDTLADLVRINSINPAFSGGTTDERLIAELVGTHLRSLGADVTRYEPEPGRVSLTGRVAGSGGGRSLMLYAHYDTVGVEGMAAPLDPQVRDGRLYGRGSYDMKCGLTACLAAVKALRDHGERLPGDLVVCAVADEETASIGMADVLRYVRTDGAIVTEPTELDVCVAHKGFCWIAVETEGRAAHGSRFTDGIDANMRMGRVLAHLERLERELVGRTPHQLVGPPSLHAGVLRGGTAPSVYAARCRLEIERRMLPSETEAQVVGEITAIVEHLAAADSTFRASVQPFLTRGGFEVAPTAPIVSAVSGAWSGVMGRPPRFVGMPYWMDAALLSQAGVDTVVVGPAGDGAHADVEWVDLQSVEQTAGIIARAAISYCG